MKILVFNGSPKGENSDTMHVTREFLKGLCSKSVHEINVINTIENNIKYCIGCLTCMRNGGECVLSDDMTEILDEIVNSELIIFSFPLYCYGMPASLKVMVDRLLPLSSIKMIKSGDRYEHPSNQDLSALKFVMICGCGFPNSVQNFEAAKIQFSLMFGGNSTLITVAEAPMFAVPQADAVTKPYLEIVKKAGEEYADNGKISIETAEKLAIPMIPEEIYAGIVNGTTET